MQSISIPTKSELALNEFYCRYKSYLLKVCRNCCRNFDSSDLLADDIFQNTLLKVLSKSHTFKLQNPSETTNISKEIKVWLSRIAKNELVNFLRKNPDEKTLSDPFRIKSIELEYRIPLDYESDISESQEEKPTTIQKEMLDKGLSVLSEREMYVLMVYMQFFDFAEPNRHLPDDLLNGICNKFNITPDNARQIKGRALKKMKKIIDELKK